MKNKIIGALVSVALIGCSTKAPDIGLAPPVSVPNPPPSLVMRAEPLPEITETSMGSMATGRATDSQQYNKVAHQLNNLIDFYACVQENLNNRETEKCFNGN